ncbi:MAG TPA: hypothetical protein VN181_11860 [Thermoanaerobaculia bacterium]|nr:hypothetical protein [Thermoanaerobaculia bacterium]
MIDRLLFVYNADSGPLAAIVDSAKKLLSINGCPLCSLTHSLVGERSEWKSCKDTLGVPIDYVHRNEVTSRMRDALGDSALPCVLAQAGDDIVVLLTSDTIKRCNGSIADLRGRLSVHAAMRELAFPADAPSVREVGGWRAATVR